LTKKEEEEMSDVSIQKSSSGVFARTSSGLVRTVSTFDTFYYCMNSLNPLIGILAAAVIVFYPGASYALSTILTVIGAIFLGITYALFSAVYPRSGAEYVPLSRVLHPLIGFVGSFSNAVWQAFYFGVAPSYAAAFAWAPLFTVLGLQFNSEAMVNLGFWFDSPVGWFVVGTIFLLGSAVILYRGAGLFFRAQRYLFTFALVGLAVLLLVLGLGSAGVFDFQASFDAYSGTGAFDALVAGAAEEAGGLEPAFNMKETLFFMVWPAFALVLAVWSTAFSGEIKNVTRGQLIAIPAAQIVGGLIMIGIGVLSRYSFGQQGLLAFGWAGLANPDLLPVAIYPWVTTLAVIMSGSPIITVVILGGILAYWLVNVPAIGLYSTRVVMAWGIDGLAPDWLGRVSERYHTPRNAIIVVTILGLIFLTIFAFTDWFSVLAAQVAFAIVLGLTAFAGAIFPFTKRDVYEASPAKYEILGIPAITITGVLALITMIWIGYRTAVDPVFGANSPAAIVAMIGTFVVATIWYFVARAVQNRRGVELDARFEEIPIE
jgi:amino acid transporter